MRGLRRDAVFLILLFVLPQLWFGPVALGNKTLLPADNLFAMEPWSSFAAELGVDVPHNELLSDLVLENYAWKQLLREAIRERELPLWNPYLLAGVPFLAAGQHSALYPPSLIFYLVPLSRAYGLFTWFHIALAGISMYTLARVLRQGRSSALLAGVVYMFSGFFIVSVVFTMIIAAAAWLPLLLACIEMTIRKQQEKGRGSYSPVPYVIAGATVLGLQTLAGHLEITYYTLLAAAFYSMWRLVQLGRSLGSARPPLRLAGWLAVLVVLGLALGAVQLVPFYELGSMSFREGYVAYSDVVGWAWPSRQILTFLIPDFFGNPSHHGYWDIWSRSWQPPLNAMGQSVRAIDWGVKNYVEGGNYIGLLALLLSVVGLVGLLRSLRERVQPDGGHVVWLFATLAILSLLLAFGTPLYALLFYALPGYKQLHSAFRWVFPYTLSMAVLAGFGFSSVRARLDVHAWRPAVAPRYPFTTILGCFALAVGAIVLALLAVSFALPGPFISLGQKVIDRSDLAQAVFLDGRAFWSYQVPNLLRFGAGLVLAAMLLIWSGRFRAPNTRFEVDAIRRSIIQGRIWSFLIIGLVLLDLWLFGHDFNPAVKPELLDFVPPVVQSLDNDEQLWRFTTFVAPEEKTFNANVGMYYGFHDVRGYDSIIPLQYVEYMQHIEEQDELLFNRIAPLSDVDSLDSPWLDLLGVRYVLTTQYIPNSGYTLLYDGEIRVYRNEDALPRAFVMSCASMRQSEPWPEGFDPRSMLWLDSGTHSPGAEPANPAAGGTSAQLLSQCTMQPASIISYGLSEVRLEARVAEPGWLVLADSFAPGWKAYALRQDDVENGGAASAGAERPIPMMRADGNFRAVFLEAGNNIVRFDYMPRSLQIGLYVSFLAGVSLFLLTGWWGWGRFYREAEGEEHTIRRVAKNTLVPMGMSLLNKGVDFVFAMLRLRVLTPDGEGSYTFAIAFYTFFEILVRFGLGTLLTREIAKAREGANRFLSNVIALRAKLWLISLPIVLLLVLGYWRWGGLVPEEGVAIGLFTVALLFAGYSDAVTATFNAYEKMEFPAGLASAVAVSKVALGALVLLPPLEWGFVGLAGVALLTNAVQAVWLHALMRQKLFRPTREHDPLLQRTMLGQSFPLMINHLLATVFWRIDIWILKPMSGAAAVGMYSAGLKWLDGLNIIPSYFTLAIFPVMSRLAHGSQESLLRAYRLALRLLLMISLPIVILVLFTAEPLINILGGAQYLPGSAIALRLLILSVPIGFINSVTQYVLIAVNQQRFLTRAFVVGVVFNVAANLIFIPAYGYRAAALILIPSELALLIPFYICVRRHVAPLPWLDILWRPFLAAGVMAAAVLLLRPFSLPLAVASGFILGGVALVLSGAFRHSDFDVLRQVIGLKRWRAWWSQWISGSSAA